MIQPKIRTIFFINWFFVVFLKQTKIKKSSHFHFNKISLLSPTRYLLPPREHEDGKKANSNYSWNSSKIDRILQSASAFVFCRRMQKPPSWNRACKKRCVYETFRSVPEIKWPCLFKILRISYGNKPEIIMCPGAGTREERYEASGGVRGARIALHSWNCETLRHVEFASVEICLCK